MLFLQRVRLTFAVAVFGADSLAHLVVPHLWATADITAAHSRRPHTQVPLRPVFPPRAHSDYLWHSTIVPVPAAVPLQPGQYDCRREQAQPPLPATCVRAVFFAGFLRVLLTHCLLCEKRRVDLLQVREQRSSQPPWPPPSPVHHPLTGTPSAGRATVHQNCFARNSSIVNS